LNDNKEFSTNEITKKVTKSWNLAKSIPTPLGWALFGASKNSTWRAKDQFQRGQGRTN